MLNLVFVGEVLLLDERYIFPKVVLKYSLIVMSLILDIKNIHVNKNARL